MRTFLTSMKLYAVMLVATVFLFSSCSKGADDLMEVVPKDANVVFTAKPEKLLTSSDLQNVLLKADVLSKGDREYFKSFSSLFASESGIDYSNLVGFVYDQKLYMVFVVKDEDDLAKNEFIRDNTTKGEDKGIVYFEFDDNSGTLFLKDGLGWIVAMSKDPDDAIRDIERLAELDSEKKLVSDDLFTGNMPEEDLNVYMNLEGLVDEFASRQMILEQMDRELRHTGMTAKDLNIDKLLKGRVFLSMLDEKETLSITGKILDEKGEPIQFTDGTIDTDILKYIEPNASFVAASKVNEAVKEVWLAQLEKELGGGYGEAQALLTELKKVIRSFEGTIALGFTLPEPVIVEVEKEDYWGDTYTSRDFNYPKMGATVVAKFKENPKKLLELAKQMGLPTKPDGTVLIPVDDSFTMQIIVDGNYMIVSSRNLPSKGFSDPGFFGGSNAAMVVNASKGSKLAKLAKDYAGVDLDMTAVMYSNEKEGKLSVKVNNNDYEGVLAYFFHTIISLSQKAEAM